MSLSFAVAASEALYIVREGQRWTLETHLAGKHPESLAVDPTDPSRLYAGTWGHGLWRSSDAGRSWEPAGTGIPHRMVTAVAVEISAGNQPSAVYAGTEPSTLSRSDDGGSTWQEMTALLDLPSRSSWSFPPKPHTHHVRWIQTDPHAPGRLYAAIEAGALVRSPDRGETWQDRVPGGPIDTHTAAAHPLAPGRLYSAAGDGYFESDDGGETWSRAMDGLRHRYLVGVAVDPIDPDLVLVSAAAGPYVAYRPDNAEAYVYRRRGEAAFELAMDGLPPAPGSVACRFAVHPTEPGVFWAANNHGLFRTRDAGESWSALDVGWPAGAFRRGVDALVVFEE